MPTSENGLGIVLAAAPTTWAAVVDRGGKALISAQCSKIDDRAVPVPKNRDRFGRARQRIDETIL